MIPIVAVVGPTASGKTALAVEIAKVFDGEVVSADSMQIYKYMDIATAKPTKDEMQSIPHHLLDFLDPCRGFSVAHYCELAHKAVSDINERGKLPIVAGGTGLYIDSLLNNISFSDFDCDKKIRNEVQAELDKIGTDAMLTEISAFDPASYERLKTERNPKRIARCVEVYRQTGMTQTELNIKQKSAQPLYKAVKIGLTANKREYLYDRINRRVDIMVENGLIDEAKAFYDGDFGTTASAAIGYKELLPYLKGEQELTSCVESLKQATRRYAKRQLTWFRRDESVHWLNIDELSFETLKAEAIEIIKKELFYE